MGAKQTSDVRQNRPGEDQAAARNAPVSGISAAALEGAAQADEERSDNSGAMARPAPGLADPRDEGMQRGSAESTAHVSELQRDQVPEDEEQQWRRAGGGNPDQP